MSEAKARECTEVGPGDYVKVHGQWKKIESNTAHGQERAPRSWTVRTTDGQSYGMFDVGRYAKAGDLDR